MSDHAGRDGACPVSAAGDAASRVSTGNQIKRGSGKGTALEPALSEAEGCRSEPYEQRGLAPEGERLRQFASL